MNWNSRIFYNKNNKKNKFPNFGEKRKLSELNNIQIETNNLLMANNVNTRFNNQIINLNLKNLKINNSNFNNLSNFKTANKEKTNHNLFTYISNEDLVMKGNIILRIIYLTKLRI